MLISTCNIKTKPEITDTKMWQPLIVTTDLFLLADNKNAESVPLYRNQGQHVTNNVIMLLDVTKCYSD